MSKKDIKMKIKNNIRLIGFTIFMLVIAIIDPHKENKSHMVFYFIEIAFCLYLFIKNRDNLSDYVKRAVIIILVIMSIIISIMGCRHLFITDAFYYSLIKPNEKVTLLERTVDDAPFLSDAVFAMYYFRDKEIIIPVEEKETQILNMLEKYYEDDYHKYFNYSVRVDTSLNADSDLMDICETYPWYETAEKNIFVVDDDMQSDQVICFYYGDKYYFCSQDLYVGKIGARQNAVDNTENQNELAVEKMSQHAIGYSSSRFLQKNMLVQIISVSLLFLIGMIVSIVLWSNLGVWFVSAVSLPVGVVLWTISGIIIVALRIPYNLISQAVIIFGLLIFVTIKRFDILKKFNYTRFSVAIFPLILALFYFTGVCYTATSYDSIKKIQFGLMFAASNNPADYFTSAGIYGFIEPYVHSMGYLLGGDYLYVLYPMFFIIILNLFLCGIKAVLINKYICLCSIREDIFYILYPLIFGITLLVTNFDFRFGKYYVMSHDLVSSYFLIFIIFTLIKRNSNIKNFSWGMIFPLAAISITRSEGIIYTLFLLTVLLGFIKNREIIYGGITICGLCITWAILQLLLYNGNSGDGYFFSPMKAVVFIFGSIAVIVFYLLIWKNRLNFILKYDYHSLYLIILFCCICFVSMFYARDLAKQNIVGIIAHMSSYMEDMYKSNSGFLWGFIFMFVPLLFAMNTKLANYSANIILGYVFLVFLVFLFRNELPLRDGYGDSARRVLVHIMPTAVFLIVSVIGEALFNNKNNSNE